MYSEFACIVDYLIQTYGKEKLLMFMNALMKDSDNNKVFKDVYSIEFEEVLRDFKDGLFRGVAFPEAKTFLVE